VGGYYRRELHFAGASENDLGAILKVMEARIGIDGLTKERMSVSLAVDAKRLPFIVLQQPAGGVDESARLAIEIRNVAGGVITGPAHQAAADASGAIKTFEPPPPRQKEPHPQQQAPSPALSRIRMGL
jgi:hypothetical protein